MDHPHFKSTKAFERIGAGHCGSVWAVVDPEPGPALAIKREDGGPLRSLTNEFYVQLQLDASLPLFPSGVAIPAAIDLLDSDHEAWSNILPRFPTGYQPCRAMVSEKIQPVPLEIRKELVKRYCPEEAREQILTSRENEHCLIRVYLGRRSRKHGPVSRFFSLRNYPLHMDQAEELELPCESYARAMARAFAFLHWAIKVDGADMEFVLGAPRPSQLDDKFDTQTQDHALWLLDFDCCRPLAMDETGLTAIAASFWQNDPYYPRPCSTNERDQALWDIFSTEYRQHGYRIANSIPDKKARDEIYDLVDKAIERIEQTTSIPSSRGLRPV